MSRIRERGSQSQVSGQDSLLPISGRVACSCNAPSRRGVQAVFGMHHSGRVAAQLGGCGAPSKHNATAWHTLHLGRGW